MIGTLYNPPGQLNIKVLLVCPYDLDHHGGVQNQIKLLKNGLVNKGINTKILGPSSYDYDIGNAVKIPFNGSQNLSLIHISSPRDRQKSRMPSSA